MNKLSLLLLLFVLVFFKTLYSQELKNKKNNFIHLSEKELELEVVKNKKLNRDFYFNLFTEFECRILTNKQDLSQKEILSIVLENQNINSAFFIGDLLFFLCKKQNRSIYFSKNRR